MIKVYQLRLRQNTFEVTLKYKGVGVRVTFEEGNVYNGTPARCYTNDPFKQRAIEASSMFQQKEIVLERTITEPGDAKKPAAPKPAVQPAPAKNENAEGNGTSAEGTPAAGTPAADATGVVAYGEGGEGAGADEGGEGTGEGNGDGEKIVFNSLAEAIVYIASHWNQSVRTENEARKVLKEHGLNPTIKRG